MLVLTRKKQQYLTLRHRTTAEVIRILLVGIRESSARIGIQAEDCWNIVRDEIDDAHIPSIQELAECSSSNPEFCVSQPIRPDPLS